MVGACECIAVSVLMGACAGSHMCVRRALESIRRPSVRVRGRSFHDDDKALTVTHRYLLT